MKKYLMISPVVVIGEAVMESRNGLNRFEPEVRMAIVLGKGDISI